MTKKWVDSPSYSIGADRYYGFAIVDGVERTLISFNRTGPWFAGGTDPVFWTKKGWVHADKFPE